MVAIRSAWPRIATAAAVALILMPYATERDADSPPSAPASRHVPPAAAVLQDARPAVLPSLTELSGSWAASDLEPPSPGAAAAGAWVKDLENPKPNPLIGTWFVLRLRRLFRSAVRWTARDMTEATTTRSALLIAPHPDDETLGCGATIARKAAAGTAVAILVVTDGRHSHRSTHMTPEQLAALRRSEMLECVGRLGLAPENVRWAGFVDGEVGDREDELVEMIVSLIAELRPQEVFATSMREGHADHATVGRATQRAVGASGLPVTLMEYPVWLWDTWPLQRGARLRSTVVALGMVATRRAYLVRTAQSLPAKLRALEAHASQLRRPPDVPAHEEWSVLPREILSNATDSVELFLRAKTT